jgi:hypothetical protein
LSFPAHNFFSEVIEYRRSSSNIIEGNLKHELHSASILNLPSSTLVCPCTPSEGKKFYGRIQSDKPPDSTPRLVRHSLGEGGSADCPNPQQLDPQRARPHSRRSSIRHFPSSFALIAPTLISLD